MNSRGKPGKHDRYVTETKKLDYRWVRDWKAERLRQAYFREQ